MALTLEAKRELLAATELFSGADVAGLELLAERTVELDLPVGHVLVRQGEDGTGLFLIVSGTVRVVHDGATVAHLGPGEVVGELAVIDRQPRLAQVVTDAPTVCLALTSWDPRDRHPGEARSGPGAAAGPCSAAACVRGVAQPLGVASCGCQRPPGARPSPSATGPAAGCPAIPVSGLGA